jgi:hypothetical protein
MLTFWSLASVTAVFVLAIVGVLMYLIVASLENSGEWLANG